VIPRTVPGVPNTVSTTAGNAQASVSFAPPADNGGSPITGYTVTTNPAGGIDRDAGTIALSHTITGLVNGTTYTFTVTASNAAGSGVSSPASNAVVPVASVTPPSAPVIGTATAGNAAATIAFTPPINDGGGPITGYTAVSNPVGGIDSDAGTTALTHTLTGLSIGTSYTFTVTATNSAGTSPPSAASNSVMPFGIAIEITEGWNLVGNSNDATMNVAITFGDPKKVSTVWKWLSRIAKWAFYAPSMSSDDLAAYATRKGYDVLNFVGGGEGFWVNALTSFSIALPSGPPISSHSFASKLESGWSLVSIGDSKTPREFNNRLSEEMPTPGIVAAPVLKSLWAWNNYQSTWYFYSPLLDNSSDLASYAMSKGYLDFGDSKLTPGTGFWVKKP